MNDYVIVTDSSCDLPEKLAESLGLEVVPLKAFIDGNEYINDLGWRSLGSSESFYNKLRSGAVATTSAPSIEAFREVYEPIFKSGRDIIYVGFSSALSSSYATGKMTGEMLAEEYPERKFVCVDSLAASMGQGLLLVLIANKKADGATLEEALRFAEETKLHICHWFTVGDLMYLKRGGRISSTAAVAGTLLNIKPVMHMDNEGRLTPVTKVRGIKAYHAKIVDLIKSTGINYDNQTLYIVHGDCMDEVNALIDYIRQNTGIKDFVVNPVGPVIGAHSGPGTLSVFFVGTER